MLTEIVVVYAWLASVFQVPHERLLPVYGIRWANIKPDMTFEVALKDGDVFCVEKSGNTECAYVRASLESIAGATVRVDGPARAVVLSCLEGERRGRLEYANGDSVGFYVVVKTPPEGYCWWEAICSIRRRE